MKLLTFLHDNLGQSLKATGGLGGECVDAVNVYLVDVWAHDPIHLNAIDWGHALLSGWAWEPNGPLNSPPFGAIVVWGAAPAVGITAFGHVAVNLLANSLTLLTMDQNWPAGAPLTLVVHSYVGVLGWWTPPRPTPI